LQWTEDFGEARNRTLAEARHPWILVLDADERIAAQDLPLIKDAIEGPMTAFISSSETTSLATRFLVGRRTRSSIQKACIPRLCR
jgi:hypothetical protein